LPGPFGEAFEQVRPFLAWKAIVAQVPEAVGAPFTEFLRVFRQIRRRPEEGRR
jgi:hypothetical protein